MGRWSSGAVGRFDNNVVVESMDGILDKCGEAEKEW